MIMEHDKTDWTMTANTEKLNILIVDDPDEDVEVNVDTLEMNSGENRSWS